MTKMMQHVFESEPILDKESFFRGISLGNARKHKKHNTSKKMYILFEFHRWAGSILSQSVLFSPKQMSLLPSACCLCTARPLGAQNRNWKKTSRGRMQKDVVEYTKTLKKTVRHKRFVCLCLSAVAQKIYHQGQRPNKLLCRPQFCRRNTTKPGFQESKRANLQSQKVSENRNPANDCPPNFYWKIV